MHLPILIADDDLSICLLVKDYLEKKGYAVLTANNGVEAMRLMMTQHPYLLICDIKMPLKDGYRLLSELRQLPEFRLLPVILLTELDDSNSRIQGYEAGCDIYLPKPFNLAELLAIVRNLLERSQMIHHELQFHRSDIPPDILPSVQVQEAAQVSIAAHLQSLSLTPRESEVLCLLATGLSNIAIGESLHLSAKTVEKYVGNLLRKTNTHNRVELAGFALKHQLIQ
jgi:DNA-binding NarL/FixJ family response regulator